MWVIKMVLQAVAIFAVSIVILTLSTISTTRATGTAAAKGQGLLLVVVGVFYVAFGAFLRSPAYEWVLRRWLNV